MQFLRKITFICPRLRFRDRHTPKMTEKRLKIKNFRKIAIFSETPRKYAVDEHTIWKAFLLASKWGVMLLQIVEKFEFGNIFLPPTPVMTAWTLIETSAVLIFFGQFSTPDYFQCRILCWTRWNKPCFNICIVCTLNRYNPLKYEKSVEVKLKFTKTDVIFWNFF